MEKKDFRQDLKIKEYWFRIESSYLNLSRQPIAKLNHKNILGK